MGKKFGNDLFLPYYQGRDDIHEGRARDVPEIHRQLMQTPEDMERSASPSPPKTLVVSSVLPVVDGSLSSSST